MPFVIEDAEVDALAEELRLLTRAETKTEAVRQALEARLAQARRQRPLNERLARSKALADSMGPSDPDFDMKRFTDAMWGDA